MSHHPHTPHPDAIMAAAHGPVGLPRAPTSLGTSLRTSVRLRVAAMLGWPLAAAIVAGCASSTPAPVLLTIPPAAIASPGDGATGATGTAAAASPAASASAAPVLAVRRVAIPEYLVSRRVRYRADPSTLAEWPNTYWAERIEIGVSREFGSAMRARLPGWTICDAGCSDRAPTLALQIELVPMDYLRAAQKLQARARITVSTGGAQPQVLQTTETNFELASGGDSAQAQAQAIAELIRRASALAARTVTDAAARPR